MSDYSELKRVAEELIAANDLFFNESPQCNEVGDAWSLADDRFTEAASPEVILALIAENEALKGPHDWLAEDLIKELVDNAQSFQDNSDHGDSDPFAIVLLAAASRIRRQEVSIERFRAENAGLKTGYEAYEQVHAGLKAEVARSTEREILQLAEIESLRKDAERYRWLRIADWWRSPVCVLRNPKEQAKLGSDCPSGDRLDAAIDAAMGKGEQS